MAWIKTKKTNNLEFEEVVPLNPAASEASLEMGLPGVVFRAFYAVIILFALLFLGRIYEVGLGRGDFYKNRALANVNEETAIPAPRGIIYDRFGKPIAQNQPVFSVVLKMGEFLKNRGEIESHLSQVIGLTKEEIDEVINKTDVENTDLVVVARDLGPDEIIRLKTKILPGIQIQDDFRRFYPEKAPLSHILGYADIEGNGKTGLERYYDGELKGRSGLKLSLRNAKGEVFEEQISVYPENGQDLATTIDFEFQSYFYNRMYEGLENLGRKSGAGLAIDPRNGEILAAVSLPSFDNNLFARAGNRGDNAQKNEILNSRDKPLFNRIISGLYNPGSTIKPLVAMAALAEGVVDPLKSIFSAGYIELPNPYSPDNPSRFVDWRAHGWINVYSALARSSNVYFYEVGGGFEDLAGLGIHRLRDWWSKLGLGKRTGVDYPSEAEGFLPDPEEKEKRTGSIWRIGDTYNVSIGQGDLLLTPLQLLNYISAIANGGKLYQPHFLKDKKSVVLEDLTDFYSEIREVRIGMEDAVGKPYGTAYLLRDLPLKTAAKTGSAQVENNTKTNAFFVGYGPEDPQIAILVLVENAKEGSVNAVPIAKDILNWYYINRLKN